jgi:hypothetical protein
LATVVERGEIGLGVEPGQRVYKPTPQRDCRGSAHQKRSDLLDRFGNPRRFRGRSLSLPHLDAKHSNVIVTGICTGGFLSLRAFWVLPAFIQTGYGRRLSSKTDEDHDRRDMS